MDKKFSILEDFPPVPTTDWEARINEDLKGADYDKKLIWHTIDGMKLKPYYRQEDLDKLPHLHARPGEFPYVRGNNPDNTGWDIQADIPVETLAGANIHARKALSKGATSVCFMIMDLFRSANDLDTLLQDINVSQTAIHFKLQEDHYRFFEWFVQWLNKHAIDTSLVKGSINMCPLSKLTATGNFYQNQEADMQMLGGIIKKYGKMFPGMRFIPVEAHVFVDAGASVSQELAYCLSVGSDYLARLTDIGLQVEEITPHIQFNMGIGSDYFPEIAKIRAARLLWSKIVKTYGVSSDTHAKVHIHSQTARWNKTLLDPYVNMLRLTTEAMSAAIGGCDSLTVQPFDAVCGNTTDFSERIAQNTQIILKEEAQINKTKDPAAGSYYIENLSDTLAEEAWKIFRQTEASGGYCDQFLAGKIHDKIKETARKKDMLLASRREVLLGTNHYPNPAENLKNIDQPGRFEQFYREATHLVSKPLKRYRGAEAFEALRIQTAQHDKRPTVFLLTIGDINWRKARASFAYGFFACAGYAVIENPGFESVDKGVEAALDAQPDIVVICSSDDEYADVVPPIHAKLQDKAIVVVAGMPPCADDLKQQDIENFIHVKSNMLDTLREYHQKLGIK